MVWIPGGAFVFGAGQLQLYNGSRLAANGNVVVVNVTYRLGVFGDSSSAGWAPDSTTTSLCATRSRRCAGLPTTSPPSVVTQRVTVFGESAGATSVLALLASPPRMACSPGRSPRAPRFR